MRYYLQWIPLDKLDLAVEISAAAHGAQKRKGTRIPYISHPVSVAMKLARLGCGRDLIIAALLHDAVEDTSLNIEEVESRFGPGVASVVRGCTEDKSKPWRERKSEMISYLRTAPLDVITALLYWQTARF